MLNRDFREFVECLTAEGVEYLVIGGYALAAFGHPRYTGDIDFWARPSPDNLGRLLRALDRFGFGSLGLKVEDFEGGKMVQLGQPPRRIDLLSAIDGVDFETCWPSRQLLALGDLYLPVIGLADFKTNKRASGRLKDLADLEMLDARENNRSSD